MSEREMAEIINGARIQDVVGAKVALRPYNGKFLGICPFHTEETPSLVVLPERGHFHCFGCGASGDALSFLMRLEGLSFEEALKRLAEFEGQPNA